MTLKKFDANLGKLIDHIQVRVNIGDYLYVGCDDSSIHTLEMAKDPTAYDDLFMMLL